MTIVVIGALRVTVVFCDFSKAFDRVCQRNFFTQILLMSSMLGKIF